MDGLIEFGTMLLPFLETILQQFGKNFEDFGAILETKRSLGGGGGSLLAQVGRKTANGAPGFSDFLLLGAPNGVQNGK